MADKYDEKYQSVHLLTIEEQSSSGDSNFDLNEHDGLYDEKKHVSPSRPSRFAFLSRFAPRSSNGPQMKKMKSLLLSVLLFLVPSFFQSRFTRSDKPAERVRPTAWLDGMRGIACWAVFNTHLSAVVSRNLGAAWGHDEDSYHFLRLPIVRLIYGGHFAVCLFFVISGFALSISPISKMNKPTLDTASAFRSLCSSTFRRPFRLFIPAFASTFCVFVLMRLDVYRAMTRMMPNQTDIVPGWDWYVDYPDRLDSTWAQYQDMWAENLRTLKIFGTYLGGNFSSKYNSVLWTISLEWRASLALFLTHAAVFFMARPFRIVCVSLLLVASLLTESFEMPLFFGGYLIAECWTPPASKSVALPTTTAGLVAHKGGLFAKNTIWWIVLFIGSFLASITTYEPHKTPLWAWLAPYSPFGYFWVYFWASLGCIMMTAAIGQLPLCMKFFSCAPVRYMGKISFSLYLVHIWIVRGFGVLVFYRVYDTIGRPNDFIAFVAFCIAYTLLLSFVVWVADVFNRLVENPTVDCAKWLEGKLFRKE